MKTLSEKTLSEKPLSDEKILVSWNKNVKPWISAIREGEIESRVAVTNQTIIDAVVERNPKKVLDLGCGEGWLVRELEKRDINTLGVDGVQALIDYCHEQGIGRFKCLPYESFSINTLNEQFDVVVCNFSLLGNESVNHLFQQIPAVLNKKGAFIVQTLHPLTSSGDDNYKDGWRQGSWAGFSSDFCDPAPWYFRTLESWKQLFADNGFKLEKILEPLNPKIKAVISIVFIGILTH